MYLVSYWVDDIDMLGGRSDNLCERLCCMVVVASGLRACGAFFWLTVCRLFSRLNYYLRVYCSSVVIQGRMLLTFCLAACPLSGTGEGIFCMPCTLCLLVLGESGQLVSGCRLREASNSCSLWHWYWAMCL